MGRIYIYCIFRKSDNYVKSKVNEYKSDILDYD